MVWMIILSVFLSLTLGVSLYANFRFREEINRLDDIYEGLFGYMNLLNNMCATVLSNEIYSNEPTIRAFINVLKDTQVALKQVNDEFDYDEEEMPIEAETLKGYNRGA